MCTTGSGKTTSVVYTVSTTQIAESRWADGGYWSNGRYSNGWWPNVRPTAVALPVRDNGGMYFSMYMLNIWVARSVVIPHKLLYKAAMGGLLPLGQR